MPSQHRSAPYPLLIKTRSGMIGAWREKAQRPMWPPPVVVAAVPGKNGPQVPSPKIRMRSVSSVVAVRTNRLAKQFAFGPRGGSFTMSMAAPARTASKVVVN
jgi:hypothetical protein